MTIPSTVRSFLEDKQVPFDRTVHTPSITADEAAEAAHVSGDKVAKAVVLRDEAGVLLAVLPASHVLHVLELGKLMGRDLRLAEEGEFRSLFPDCEPGAVPAVGPAYGLETVVSDALADADEIWFEAGDHVTLLHVSGEDFRRLLSGATLAGMSSHRH
ncbi:MAG: YbaK/EbsC family protein [Gammaproteobacteria bacterium]